MDQRLIAGLGNLMSDETLWRARVNRARHAARSPAGAGAPSTTPYRRPSASRFPPAASRTGPNG
jgi:hypothetical protein